MSSLKWRGPEVIEKAKAAIPDALYAAGLVCEGQAKIIATEKDIVDTGNLVDSITTAVAGGRTSPPGSRAKVGPIGAGDELTARVGTAVEYAVYQEFGATYWNAASPRSLRPRPFLRPAVDEHKPAIRRAFAAQIRKAFS